MNDRARVPFALVGVLLLAGSATLAPALTTQPDLGQPDVDVAMDRLTAQAVSAMEDGVAKGARLAASNPVVTRANTTFGRVLDENRTFRDALEVRVYTAVRDSLAEVTAPRRGLRLEASVPPTDTPAALERAIDRVKISPAGPNGTALRASVGNVTLTARRNGQVVGRKRIDPSVTVQVPTLVVHERVSTFEERLDGGPLEPGLGRRLTGKLYALTWARGYAQYYRVPIENVVANRHLTLLANGAVLSTQRRVFGRSDPVGRRVHGVNTMKTAIMDVLATASPDTVARLQRFRRLVDLGDPQLGEAMAALTGGVSHPDPGRNVSIGVNATAERAHVTLMTRFNETIDEAFSADTRVRPNIVGREGARPDWPTAPEERCVRLSQDRSRSVAVRNRSTSFENASGDWHLLWGVARDVSIERTRRRAWRCGDETVRRSTSTTETVAVNLRLEGMHHNGAAPRQPIETVHEPAGPFDGPNLADVRAKAVSRLLPNDGTIDYLAERVALGKTVDRTATIQGEWPDRLYPWVYEEVVGLRERLRNYSVNATKGEIATLQAEPATELLHRVEDDTVELAGLPVRYDNVSHRALVSVKWEYIELVERLLKRRVERRNRSRSKLAMELHMRENASLSTMQSAYHNRNDWTPPEAAGVRMRVNAGPSYLPTSRVTRDSVRALRPGESYHPLVARNFNVFTLPYGDFAGVFTKAIFGPKHVRLRTGAQLLRAADRLGELNASLASAPEVLLLKSGVEASLDTIGQWYGSWMSNGGFGSSDGWVQVYEDALAKYRTTRTRAMAVANGSIVPRLVDAAAERWPRKVNRPTWRDRIRVRTNYTLQKFLREDESGPTQPEADGTVGPVRAALQAEVGQRLSDLSENATMAAVRTATNRSWSRLPSGLPVAPVPGLWYATVNLWHAQVRGEYARFGVTVPRGTPANPGASLAYIRDGAPVSVDVDGDGDPDRLGTASRVSFRTQTLVAIAVPPYSPGVGDIDGVQNEVSTGWPWPSDPPPGAK